MRHTTLDYGMSDLVQITFADCCQFPQDQAGTNSREAGELQNCYSAVSEGEYIENVLQSLR